MSTKQDAIDRELRKTYQRISLSRDQYTCQGCQRTDKPLSHSHTISRKRCKEIGKPELIYDEGNIEMECFGTNNDCHNIWEWEGIAQRMMLHNFERKMVYISQHDPERFQAIQIQIESVTNGLGQGFTDKQSKTV